MCQTAAFPLAKPIINSEFLLAANTPATHKDLNISAHKLLSCMSFTIWMWNVRSPWGFACQIQEVTWWSRDSHLHPKSWKNDKLSIGFQLVYKPLKLSHVHPSPSIWISAYLSFNTIKRWTGTSIPPLKSRASKHHGEMERKCRVWDIPTVIYCSFPSGFLVILQFD